MLILGLVATQKEEEKAKETLFDAQRLVLKKQNTKRASK
jgi:hypothetical protein